MATCGATKTNGAPCKGTALPGGPYCMVHKAKEPTETRQPGTAIDIGRASSPYLRPVGREQKMLKPECAECEAPGAKRARWWEFCTHNPYFRDVEREVSERVLGERDGKVIITGREETVEYETVPNLHQESISKRINGGQGVAYRQRHGYLLPEQHNPPFKPFCQFRDCWNQSDVKDYKHGQFCREDEARLVAADEQEVFLEVVNPDKRARQLSGVSF